MKKGNLTSEIKSSIKLMYQNVGGQWFAFAHYQDEIFCAKVPVHQSPDEYGQELKKEILENSSEQLKVA